MDDVIEMVKPEEDEIGHPLAKNIIGGIAAYGVNKLTDRLFDAAIRTYRARKSS